jgi:hypothetical protein
MSIQPEFDNKQGNMQSVLYPVFSSYWLLMDDQYLMDTDNAQQAYSSSLYIQRQYESQVVLNQQINYLYSAPHQAWKQDHFNDS